MTKKKIVLGYGHFSAIHPGHIRYLKEAKELGDTLIVAIKPDSQEIAIHLQQKNEPLQLPILIV